MTTEPTSLSLARGLIRALIVLNAVYAAAIALLLVASIVDPVLLTKALTGLDGAGGWPLPAALRTVVVIGLAGAWVAYRVLRHLLAIVRSVGAGDPFIAANAGRLQAIAWWVLAGEGLRLAAAAVAWAITKAVQPLQMHVDGFSFAPWLAVLLLFVLARVFAEGTRMRADLDGTV